MSKNVYQLITEVQHALCKDGIGKNRKNQQQGYAFRGIDDVYNALSSVLAEKGLCILPRVIGCTRDERQTKNGGVLFYTTVEVEFDFVSSHDGSKHTVKVFGEAMDSADKSTNKAMSAAYKYAAFLAFCIPTEGDNDADATTHNVAPKQAKRPLTIETKNAALAAIDTAQDYETLNKIFAAFKGSEFATEIDNACKKRAEILKQTLA